MDSLRFVALKDFFSEELQSQYVTGLSYTVFPDAAHAKLAALVPQWVDEGMIAPLLPDNKTVVARVSGAGKIE